MKSVFALSYAFGSRTLILHKAVLLGKMQIVIVLFILIVMHRPFNYHAIEISSSYSNCLKESYIWESKKAFRRNTNEKKRRKTNYKGDIEIWLEYFIIRHNYGCLWCTYIFFAPRKYHLVQLLLLDGVLYAYAHTVNSKLVYYVIITGNQWYFEIELDFYEQRIEDFLSFHQTDELILALKICTFI